MQTADAKRYAIYGAGSLGTVLGAFIQKNGGRIDLINRNKAHVEALRQNGAVIRGTVSRNHLPLTQPEGAAQPRGCYIFAGLSC